MPTDQEMEKDRWTIWVCPPKGTEEGMWSSAETGSWREVAAYRNLGKPEAVEVCRVSELEAEKQKTDYWHDLLTHTEAELEAEKEHSRRGDEEVRKLEAALDRCEDRAAIAEKALKETLDLLRGIAADSSDPASRACATHWLATHNDNEEDPNA